MLPTPSLNLSPGSGNGDFQQDDFMPPAAAAGPAIIIILGVLSAFGPLSMDMYLPGLPALAAWFATSPGNAQLTLSAFVVGFALCQQTSIGNARCHFGYI